MNAFLSLDERGEKTCKNVRNRDEKNIRRFDDDRTAVREKKLIRFETAATEVTTRLSFHVLHFLRFANN